jgi:hypothetical protein
MTSYNVYYQKNDYSGLGFTALAAPHTIIIPTLCAILADLHKHRQKRDVETPHWQWYVFPWLVLPMDGLQLAYNVKRAPNNPYTASLSGWALGSTVCILVWSAVSGNKLYTARGAVGKKQTAAFGSSGGGGDKGSFSDMSL